MGAHKGYFEITKRINISQPYHWVLKARNNEVILTSENYSNKQGAENGIRSVQNNCKDDKNYDRSISNGSKEPYFTLKAQNGEIIGTSEMYSSNQKRDDGIKSVKMNGTTDIIKDLTK